MANGRLIPELGFFNISLGQYQGYRSVFKFGEINNAGTSEEVLWDQGDFSYLTSAEYMLIVSDNSNDTYGGSGAWNILIYGLDDNHNEINEVIILNGTTPVQSQNQYLRVYRAFVIQSGIYDPVSDANEGDIQILAQLSGTVQAGISSRVGQTLMTQYTIPANHTGIVTGISASVGEGKDVKVKGKANNVIGGAFSTKFALNLFQGIYNGDLKVGLTLPEKTDICLTVQSTKPNVNVTGSYGLILKKNE